MADGQVLESPYLPLVEPSLMPAWLDHVSRARGVAPPRGEAGRYRYVDLGCGYGMVPLYLAATHPDATLIGVDANPDHIDVAREVADRAGLENVAFHCARFGDPELSAIQPVDYVAANGVYTWLPDEVRALLVAQFRDLLLPGGTAMVGYNLMRGWLALLPIQRIIAQVHADIGADDDADTFARSSALVEAVAESTNASIFRLGAETFAGVMKSSDPRYHVHEFLAPGWRPVWTGELAEAMATAGCRYVGDLHLDRLRDDYALNARQRALIADAGSPEMEWLLRDLFWPRHYARGLFHRSAHGEGAEPPSRFAGWLRLKKPAGEVVYECKTAAGRLGFDSPLAREIVDWLAGGPADLATLATESGDADTVLATLDALCMSGQAVPCDPPQAGNRVEALNRVIDDMELGIHAIADPHATPVPKKAKR